MKQLIEYLEKELHRKQNEIKYCKTKEQKLYSSAQVKEIKKIVKFLEQQK